MSALRGGQQDQHEIVHVAVAPPDALGADLIKRTAFLIGKEIADTRLLLAGEIPRIVATCLNADTAGSIAQSLRDAGLVAFICRDSDLRNRPPGFSAHTLRSGEREVIFGDRRGGETGVETGDAFLIISGRIQSPTQEKSSTTKIKLNVPATVLAGGIPILRRVTEKTTGETFPSESFVKIYDGKSLDPRVALFQNHVDYSLLGSELTPSALRNFKIVVTKLRAWFPPAIFDERLTRSHKNDVPVAGPGEALEIQCQLIYLGYLAIRKREVR
jgi:hypothetical protein